MTVAINKSIMILDEDPAFCRIYQSIFERAGYHVLMSSGRKSGLELLKKENPQAVFIEIRINGSPAEGLCFIEEALRERPNLTIIVVSNIGGCDARSRALDRGATEYVVKSSPDEIESHIQKIVQKIDCEIRLKEAVEKDGGLDIGSGRKFIGKSPDMWRVYRLIQKVAENRSSALILGETGTGKELIARAIHAWKKERTPFVSINCGFLTKTLLESQLFGVCKDYPGLHNYKKKLIGKLETVSDGMLLLDEIGNMDMDLQVSLLRVLQEKEFYPIGDEKPLPFRAQVVASTNVDLKSAIDAGRFRNDLYYRLNVVSIVLPPLHQRKEDIPLLVGYYLEQHEKQFGRRVVLPQAMDKLIEYHWPGNIRELFNALERVLTTYSSPDLAPGYFDFLLSKPIEERKTDATVQDDIAFGDLSRKVESYEKKVLLRTLEASEWNQTKTAEKLKLTRTNLIWKMKKYGLLRKRLMA